MDLPTAQLGSSPSINMGGYVPAPAYRPKLSRQMLDAFLTAAGGAAGGKLTEGMLTPDYSQQAAGDQTLQKAGMAPQQRGALSRFFTPMTQEQYLAARQAAQQQQYQQLMGGIEQGKLGVEKGQLGVAQAGEQSEAGARLAEAQQRQSELGEQVREFGARIPIEQQRAAAESGLAGAQTNVAAAEAARGQAINRGMGAQGDQQILGGLEKNHPEIDHPTASRVLQIVGAPSSFFAKNPNATNADYEAAFTQAAQQINKQAFGTPATAPAPQGLGSVLNEMLNSPSAQASGRVPFSTQLPGM